jgi:cytochrome c oxidase subunit 3
MGLPLPNGKLAIWFFLVTEIMFFTALIGTYMILRNGTPTDKEPWPTPHDVHLVEAYGAINTFVLICSSVTVVLAHWTLGRGNVRQATLFIAATLGLGLVFMGIKAIEYKSKWDHHILPGQVGEKLDTPAGQSYFEKVAGQLRQEVARDEAVADCQALLDDMPLLQPAAVVARVDALVKKHPGLSISRGTPDETKTDLEKVTKSNPRVADCQHVLGMMSGKDVEPDPATPQKFFHPPAMPKEIGKAINALNEKYDDLHLYPNIPYGNLWASCYFALTGFHALHVLGGIVAFAIILLMAARGTFGVQNGLTVELVGLYWHFVDIVWIFLFPLIYLV